MTIAEEMRQMVERLFPICRSLTGNGVRETLQILSERIPLSIHEIPTGTPVFDWTIPKEWNIRDAYILDPRGQKIVDFHESNLHVVNYSTPVDTVLSLEELRPHLHTLPDQPDVVPYLTSYYKEQWGFCITHCLLESLQPGDYTVVVDSSLEPGSLTYGDLVLPGETSQEILLATNICHPSMACHELSGPVTLAFLYQRIAARKNRYTYRFLFNPETVGAIAYLAEHGEHLRQHLVAGYTLLCLGMPGGISLKRSRRGDTPADLIAEHILRNRGGEYCITDFIPIGSDERQFCSPGFNLPVASIRRGEPGHFPQYHTSLDNLSLISYDVMIANLELVDDVLCGFEADRLYQSNCPYCEPQLGKRGLYRSLGSTKRTLDDDLRMFFVLNYADGEHSLRQVADKIGCNLLDLVPLVQRLCECDLIRPAD